MPVDLGTSFTQFTLTGGSINNPTSLQFGPDGRLYVAQQDGLIKAFTVERSEAGYTVTSTQTISLVKDIPNHNDDGALNGAVTARQVTGLLVMGTPENPVIYVGSSDPRIAVGHDSNLDTNSGIISRLTLNSSGQWEKVDLVRGLPRSEENHSLNGLQYDAATNSLLIGVGGNTNMGAPSNSFGYLPEYTYSAAILKVDLTALDAMSVKVDASSGKPQSYVYDLPTLNDPTRADATETVFGGNDGLNMAKIAADSPVQVYSPGYRNPYDLVLTEGGKLYVMDNGPNKDWGGPPVIGPNGITNQVSTTGGTTKNDTLQLVTHEGYYGGHPNPIRANGGAAGLPESDGDPTDGIPDGALRPTGELPADWAEVVAIVNGRESSSVSDAPPLWSNGQSTNGIAEYTASNFGGELKGDLLTVGYGGTLYRLHMSDDGKSVLSVQTLSVGGTPLDVVAQGDGKPFAGSIWVAKYGADSITILEPSPPTTPPPVNDDDEDGILNPIDRFGMDASNGLGTVVLAGDTLSWGMSAADPNLPGPADNLFGLGFTGLMVDWQTPYGSLYDIENLTPGGAGGVFTIDEVGAGTATGAVNSQREAFQFGITPDAGTRQFTIISDLDNPFDSIAHPTDDQSQGIYLGTGDQDNYVRVAVHAHGGAGGIEVTLENGGVPTTVFYNAPGLIAGASSTDTVSLSLEVNVELGLVVPHWSYTTGGGVQTIQGSGDAVQVSGPLLEALQGWYTVDSKPSGLAVGIIATSDGEGTPFSATWDNIRVVAPPNTIIADSPDDIAGQGTNGKDIVLYSGSAAIAALDAAVDDVNFADNANNISVAGNALANVFTVGTGANVLRGGAGADTFRGTAAALNGDRLTDFFTGDKIVIEGATNAGTILSFSQSTRKLAIDSNGDGTADTTITLDSSPFAAGTSLADFTTSIVDGAMTIGYAPKAGGLVVAINSGGNSYFDADTGITYATDTGQFANGGGKYSSSTIVAGTNDQSLYGNERYSTGDLLYNIPVANGDYIVTLKFAEIYSGITGPNQRLFDVRAEGQTVLDNLDLYASAGPFHAYDWTGVVQVDDGMLSLDFLKGAAENPKIAAILIQEAGSLPPPGGATIKINTGATIDTSTYNASAFQITNTGSKAIVSISFDTTTNALPGVVFDPAGTAGDTATKNLKIDSFGSTGAVQPATGDYSPFSGGHDGGYDRMTVSFNPTVNGGFNPGETVKFSVDIDPLNIKGSGIDGDAGSISGLELFGTTVTITYADGSTQTTRIFGDGSAGGGEATLGAEIAPAPVLSLGGVSSGEVGVTTSTQTVSVSGRPGDVVKVLLMTGGSGNNVQPADMFDANKAIAVEYRTVTLDSSGHGSLQVTLPPANPVYMAATVDDGGPAGTGMVSAPLIVAWDSNTRTFVGTSAADNFTGAAGFHWIVSGLAGNDTLTTQGGDDRVTGDAGNDTISTGAGNDLITYSGTSTGADAINGGIGDDRIEALANGTVIGLASVTNVETISAGGWTGVKILGSTGGDTLNFSGVVLSGISVIDGGKGSDIITGSADADVIAGGEGADTLAGGNGDDVFQVAALTGTDIFQGGSGFDRIVAIANGATVNGLGLNSIEEISSAGFTGLTIVASGGNDLLDLSAISLSGVAAIDGGAGNDGVIGSNGADTIIGGAGNDTLEGLGGDDQFLVGTGGGTDSFDGGAGFDRVIATAAGVTLSATRFVGIEEISGAGLSGVTIAGTGGNENFDFTGVTLTGIGSIAGGGGDDLLIGSGGNDTILGGLGSDEIGGGGGSNVLTGNEGADLFRLAAPTSGAQDQITDFTAGSDKLVIVGADFGLTGADVTTSGTLRAQRLTQGSTPTGTQGQFLYASSTGLLKWDADGTGAGAAIVIATLAAGTALQAGDILVRGIAPPPVDTTPPSASGAAANLTATATTHVVTVTYSDAGSGVDAASIGTDDIVVTGPTGVTVSGVTTTTNASGATVASYTLSSADGFTAQDNGNFTVSLVAGSVQDNDGNGVAAGSLTGFSVSISASNVINGTAAGETITGTSGADTIYGLGGNDTLDGAGGADTLYGGIGSDQYYVDSAGDVVVELAGEGTDLVNSYVSFTLSDNVENLFLRGGAHIDGTGNTLGNRMEGNDSINVLTGLAGNDTLIGRGGADQLRGDAGADIFDYNLASDSRNSSVDLILDFTQGQDKIDFGTIDANSLVTGNQNFAFIGTAAFSGTAGELRYALEAPGTTAVYVDINDDGVADMHVRLTGGITLQASDFLL